MVTSLTLLFAVSALSGQGRSMQNWYWGDQCALDFSSSPPLVKSHKHKTYTHNSACISDENTGKLLFFTYGPYLFDANGDTIGTTGVKLTEVTDMVILPLAALPKHYLLVINLKQSNRNHYLKAFVVNMALSGNANVVVGESAIPGQGQPMNLMNRITAVKHCYMDGYWIIGIAYPNIFQSFYVSGSGAVSKPVSTSHPVLFPQDYAGDLVISGDGKMLLFTPYTDKPEDLCRIYKFDSRCGTFDPSYAQHLPAETNWTRAHGAAFSPDNRLIYISYGYQESQLVQYNIADPNDHTLIATSAENFNQMALAPDGKIYITTHISGIPCNKLDVIERPNEKGVVCKYTADFLRTAGPTNFHIPNFVTAFQGNCAAGGGDLKITIDPNRCAGKEIAFSVNTNNGLCDSLKWLFADPQDPKATSRDKNARHIYQAAGTYRPALVVWFCSVSDTLFREIQIDALVPPQLGPDQTVCKGVEVKLGPGTSGADKWIWSTGSTDSTIVVHESGLYHLVVSKGNCSMEDEIKISNHPPIFTALGAEYFICEEQDELVQLDAGEGFKRYKWTPTGDTTQWIVVDKRGEYFVLVEDFRGCKADDGAVVTSICDMRIWFPSSFTPNDDGLNDVFKGVGQNLLSVEVLVYNRWGEEVFHSFELNTGWDGMYLGNHASEGAYVWKARATGFLNKKKVINNYYGTVELLR